MFSSDAKLFVKRRLQFHFSHAENVSSKLPKWTLFLLHLHLFNYSSTRYTSRRICFVSCLYISTYLKMFLVRFINRLAASHAVLPWFGCFFFSSCWCCDPKCLAGVEVCRGEKYSRQKLDRRYHHLAVNLLSKNRHANRRQWKLKIPPLWPLSTFGKMLPWVSWRVVFCT